jgi:porin
MKRMRLNIAVVIMVILCMALPSQAEEAAPAKTDSGDIWSRSTLTGDWGGCRTWLEEHGITLAPRLTQFYQGLAAGDGDHDFK